MSIRTCFTAVALGLLLATSAAGCAGQIAAPPVTSARAVELTLHETSVSAAQSYAQELRASGRYQTVEVRMETPETARIRATTLSLSLRPSTTVRQ